MCPPPRRACKLVAHRLFTVSVERTFPLFCIIAILFFQCVASLNVFSRSASGYKSPVRTEPNEFPCDSRIRSSGVLQGTVVDANSAALPSVKIVAVSTSTGISRTVTTDAGGFYQFVALPVGTYRVTGQLTGFQTQIAENVFVEVGRVSVLNLQLVAGSIDERVQVKASTSLVDLENVSVGQVINERTVQELPLNGRFFVDLGLLVPGSVTPPQSGFLTAPTRGGGSLALNTAGNREDTVNFQVNGITLNDQLNNTLVFNPPLTSIREFKIDNSTLNAETGRNSGAVVNVATRSGTREFHGELYEYFRNDALDARNFFNFTSARPPPFRRNQFGGALGGPVILPGFGEGNSPIWNGRDTTFFFFSYENLEQRQGVDINTPVLSDAQRNAVTDPIILRLIEFIPRANFFDSGGNARFGGSTAASADAPQWTLDISHNFSDTDRLHAYFANQDAVRTEPVLFGTTVPGFGDIRLTSRQFLTLKETHIFSPFLVNEVRFGFHFISLDGLPFAQYDPSSFGINIGIDEPIGLPQINVSGGFNFGGPARLPLSRDDTTIVIANTVSYIVGAHSLRIGGEYRKFDNSNVRQDTGLFNFPTVSAFIEGTANSFSITRGTITNVIKQTAVGGFIQDSYKWRRNLTLDLGFRYDINFSPTEPENKFIVFDPATVSLLRVGRDIDEPYRTTYTHFQPRAGLAWDPFGKGKTSLRTGFGIYVEQPTTNGVSNVTGNPPLATPLSYAGPVRLTNGLSLANADGLAPLTIDPNYTDSSLYSWNLNVQHEIRANLAVMIGYFGSKGTHLRLARNINQPINGRRPFLSLSVSSPELPGTPLGNIVQVESTGNSNYNALWASLTKRLSGGLQFSASYTWSKSIDYNSASSPPATVTVQDSYNIRNDRGLSDFDARHRLVFSSIYELPFKGNQFKRGWQIGLIAQFQGGNPLNIVTNNSSINGVANTIRPDVVGPIDTIGSVERWFGPSAFVAVNRFGSLGRNVVIGPGFSNVDLSVLKTLKVNERIRLQLRAELFDLFNWANFGQPGRVVGSSSFGQVTNTRFPTGDSGSSRQMQFVLKLSF